MECDAPSCKKEATYETIRQDRTLSPAKKWCVQHFSEKVEKYEMNVKRIKK